LKITSIKFAALHVLYIEDDPGLARLLKKNLERLGNFSVEVAETGEDGLKRLQDNVYDVVLVDYNMPGYSGTDVIRLANATKKAPPCIMITSSDSAHVATEALKNGAHDFICKDAECEYLKLLPAMIYQVVEKEKHAKKHLRMQQRIKENEERFRKLVELSPDGIAIIENNKFVYVNPSAVSLLGAKDDQDLIGGFGASARTIWDYIVTDEKQRYLDLVDTAMLGSAVPWTEFRMKDSDNRYAYLEITGVEYRWKDRPALQIVFRDISYRKEMQKKLELLAYHDALTGLPNRKLFQDRLHQALNYSRRNRKRFAVFFLDLDKFKEVNDTAGHDVGDQLLIEVSRRLQGLLRETDSVCRIGGDEFTILLADLQDKDRATLVAAKVIAAINEPVEINGQSFSVGSSIGISYFPEHGKIAEELMKNADDAMYISKANGRNQYTLYEVTPLSTRIQNPRTESKS